MLPLRVGASVSDLPLPAESPDGALGGYWGREKGWVPRSGAGYPRLRCRVLTLEQDLEVGEEAAGIGVAIVALDLIGITGTARGVFASVSRRRWVNVNRASCGNGMSSSTARTRIPPRRPMPLLSGWATIPQPPGPVPAIQLSPFCSP
jgi:hypothetical protein